VTLLKNGMRLLFLWFKIFFLSENWSWVSWMLIYVITLGWPLSWVDCLEKVTHDGWLEALTILSLFLEVELRMAYMKDYRDSWMKMMLNFFLFSRIVFVSILFFWTFCEKSFRFLKIMNLPHLQISGLICFCF